MRIEDMSIDQLLELNRYICRRIDELRDQENLQALSQLRVGLKVTFEGREGPLLGIVTKINRKNVIVLGEDGATQYKVSPGLLLLLRDMSKFTTSWNDRLLPKADENTEQWPVNIAIV